MAGESSRYASFEALTRKHGFVCISASEIDMDKLIVGVGEIIGIENVKAVSRMNKKDCFFSFLKCRWLLKSSSADFSLIPIFMFLFPPLDTPAKKL